jgi:hypothetical protein
VVCNGGVGVDVVEYSRWSAAGFGGDGGVVVATTIFQAFVDPVLHGAMFRI